MWIARDLEGDIYLFKNKPVFQEYHWYDYEDDDYCGFKLPRDMFPHLTNEDGPIEVGITPKSTYMECSHCGKGFWYKDSDIIEEQYEEPWESGLWFEEGWLKCPDCGKDIRIY